MTLKQPSVRVTAKPALWEDITSLMNALADDAVFEFRADGLHLIEKDPAHVCLLSLDVPKGAFEQYEIATEIDVGLDLNDLMAMLRIAGERSVTMIAEPDNGSTDVQLALPNGLSWFFDGIGTGGRERSKLPFRGVALPVTFPLQAASLWEIIELGLNVSEHVTIKHAKGQVVFESSDGPSHDRSVAHAMTNASGTAKSTFSLDYLSNFVRTIKDQDTVQVLLGTDMFAEICGTTASGVRFRYFLAPKIVSGA